MKAITFTFVYERIGKKTPHGKIVKCPRCGRKGARRDFDKPMGNAIANVSHAGKIEWGFRVIDDHCFITAEDDAGTGQ